MPTQAAEAAAAAADGAGASDLGKRSERGVAAARAEADAKKVSGRPLKGALLCSAWSVKP